MYNIIVCDDNKAFTEIIVKILNKHADLFDLRVMGFVDSYAVMDYCLNNKFDIIYMDIELGAENGMRLAKKLKAINSKALIIYMSAYDDYYIDMVQAEPFRFILKDSSELFWAERLEREVVNALKAALKRICGENMWSFVFDKKEYHVELRTIKYFYSVARTIHIVGDIGEVPDYYYGKMDELQGELERVDGNFVRINKRCIANINYCQIILNKKHQVLIDNKIFSVTSKYREVVTEKIKKYRTI